MAMQSSGQIKWSEIQSTHGGTNPINISEYYGKYYTSAGARRATSGMQKASYLFSTSPSVAGGWTAYGSYGSCSVSCGGGTQSRTRSCTSPAPSYGGANCSGSSSDSQSCNTQGCFVAATGGSVVTSGNYKTHTFTGSGTFSVSNAGVMQYIVVAGGGGATGGVGGVNYGAGGGGGTTNTNNTYSITTGSYTISVGGGGSGTINGTAGSGGSSYINGVNTAGGGVGTAQSSRTGGGNDNYSGGTNTSFPHAGGGAGGGGNGSSSNGGPAYSSSIGGSSVAYAGGGAGGQSGTPGSGGGTFSVNGGSNGASSRGGGAGAGDANHAGGSGGSGIVIIKYQYQ